MITLLVDEILTEGRMARTKNADKISYNLQQLGSKYYHWFQNKSNAAATDQFIDMVGCGRYIVILSKSKCKKNTYMLFYDTRNSHKNAAIVAGHFLTYEDGIKNQQLFLNAFKALEPHYDKKYTDTLLTLDTFILC